MFSSVRARVSEGVLTFPHPHAHEASFPPSYLMSSFTRAEGPLISLPLPHLPSSTVICTCGPLHYNLLMLTLIIPCISFSRPSPRLCGREGKEEKRVIDVGISYCSPEALDGVHHVSILSSTETKTDPFLGIIAGKY